MRRPRILPVLAGGAERVAAIRCAAGLLGGGSLVVMPTDTVYGVAADAWLPGALEKIYSAKSRDRGKPVPLLAADCGVVKGFGAEFDELEAELAGRYWPGPLTLVLRVRGGTEGFRVPDHDVSQELLRAAGGLLRVTSANISGEPPALTAEEALRALGDSVDAVLDAGRMQCGIPSTVARVENGTVVVLREGAISAAELAAV